MEFFDEPLYCTQLRTLNTQMKFSLYMCATGTLEQYRLCGVGSYFFKSCVKTNPWNAQQMPHDWQKAALPYCVCQWTPRNSKHRKKTLICSYFSKNIIDSSRNKGVKSIYFDKTIPTKKLQGKYFFVLKHGEFRVTEIHAERWPNTIKFWFGNGKFTMIEHSWKECYADVH